MRPGRRPSICSSSATFSRGECDGRGWTVSRSFLVRVSNQQFVLSLVHKRTIRHVIIRAVSSPRASLSYDVSSAWHCHARAIRKCSSSRTSRSPISCNSSSITSDIQVAYSPACSPAAWRDPCPTRTGRPSPSQIEQSPLSEIGHVPWSSHGLCR
jgi:hypothetical protein